MHPSRTAYSKIVFSKRIKEENKYSCQDNILCCLLVQLYTLNKWMSSADFVGPLCCTRPSHCLANTNWKVTAVCLQEIGMYRSWLKDLLVWDVFVLVFWVAAAVGGSRWLFREHLNVIKRVNLVLISVLTGESYTVCNGFFQTMSTLWASADSTPHEIWVQLSIDTSVVQSPLSSYFLISLLALCFTEHSVLDMY